MHCWSRSIGSAGADLFFAGENGKGKSNLLEAIAAHYGFGREGGNRNFANDSTDSNHSIDALVRALRLSFDRRPGAGYFLRAESWFNSVSHMDELDREPSGHSPPISSYYGGRSLHTRSHGETFFTLLELKLQRNGLFPLDEPEAALSPQRQLSFLVLIYDVLRKHKDAQFIISSPNCAAFPESSKGSGRTFARDIMFVRRTIWISTFSLRSPPTLALVTVVLLSCRDAGSCGQSIPAPDSYFH